MQPPDPVASEHGWRPEVRLLLSLGVPVILVNITLTAMQLTDAWMVGRLGSEELAAITPPSLVLFMLNATAYGLLSATTTYTAQHYGRQEYRRCGQYAWNGIWLGALFAILTTAGCRYGAGPFFELFPNDSQRVLLLEVRYLEITAIGLFPALIAMAVSNFFIGVQANRVIVLTSAITFITNVLLSYGLIYGEFGLPELGFEGAAVGTVLAMTLEAILLGLAFVSAPYAKDYRTRWPSLNFSVLHRLVRLGLPAGAQNALDSGAWGLALSWLVGFSGTAHQAAATIAFRCMQVSFLPAEGIAIASLALVGTAVGAGRLDLAERRARFAFRIIAAYMVSVGALLYYARQDIVRIFSDDPDVQGIGAAALVFVAAFQLFDAMTITYLHALQGVGDNRWTLRTNVILCVVVLFGGGLVTVQLWPGVGSLGVWAVATVYLATTGLAFRLRWTGGVWKARPLLGGAPRSPLSNPDGGVPLVVEVSQ